jgi:hypothetical protein
MHRFFLFGNLNIDYCLSYLRLNLERLLFGH